MVTDLAAKLYHSLYGRFTALHILSQHKERNMDIVFLNSIKKCLCILSRTIIKGQSDHRALLGRIIRAILIKIIVLHTFLHPSGLHVSLFIKAVCCSVNIRKTIYIICTIWILIPLSCRILMPSRSHNRKPFACCTALYRHHRCIRTGIRAVCIRNSRIRRCRTVLRTAVCGSSGGICLDIYCLRILIASAAYMVDDGKNYPSNNKNQQKNRRKHTGYPLHHPPPSYLLLLSAHSLAQNSFVHLIISPSIYL